MGCRKGFDWPVAVDTLCEIQEFTIRRYLGADAPDFLVLFGAIQLDTLAAVDVKHRQFVLDASSCYDDELAIRHPGRRDASPLGIITEFAGVAAIRFRDPEIVRTTAITNKCEPFAVR